MEFLDNPVRRYAWGSRTVIAGLQGRPVPSPHPEAELWLGAHPGDPSYLVGDGQEQRRLSLLDELTGDPETRLGSRCAGRWSGRLPFLLKVLAADEPLSLQAHPSAELAEAGYARENDAGIALDDARRNYKDPNHKPELVCALTEFHALTGFREPAATVALLRELAVPELAGHVELLAGQPDERGLRALFSTWITLPQQVLDRLVPAVQEGCVRLLRRADPDPAGHRDVARTVLELSERYPGDAGVLAALLLNRVTLAPGEALYQGDGVLHAYLSGACIELMANSDNVLRGGLTPKHVDVPELLRLLDFGSCRPPIVHGITDGALTRYDTVAEEFRLWRLDWAEANVGDVVSLPDGGPRILLCTSGAAKVSAGSGRSLTLRRGESLWLDATDCEVKAASLDEPAQLFLATDGL
ncbi:mannose-6-phosphate isomerase, class I [Pseudonocardia acaciae]|uniref:mannose-6-phosphate isomerase, class I n=1 Tax=Pseudonocardia acaciae TaxID=551276 RepID=UPI00048C9548|nr:mannose-6-phosphate isomerase, class I [Pseudonocardia acaciae]